MEFHIRVSLQKLFHQLGLVCRKIVQNDVNLLLGLTTGDHLIQETHKLDTGMTFSRLALNLTRLYIQRGV